MPDAALGALPAYPMLKPANPVSRETPPMFSLDTAGKSVSDAAGAERKATSDVAAAEAKAAQAGAAYTDEQSRYIEGLRRKEQEELKALEPQPFKPNQNDLANMTGLFTLVGMMGAFMGGKGTAAAAGNAQAALTGMLGGWVKGNDQEVAQQKAIYDENVGLLKDKADKVRQIYKDYYEDAQKFGVPTAQGRLLQRLKTEAEADVNAEKVRLAGAQAGAKQANDIFKVAEAMQNHRDSLQAANDRADEANAVRLAIAQANAAKNGNFTPDMGELMAALAERGVSLPSGLRSRQQQAALYQGLLTRHPGKTPDEIADMIKSGQINLKAETKESQIAAGIAGRISIAENEIGPMGDLVLDAAKRVPRTSFLPINKLLAMSENQLQDPNLRDLQSKIYSLLSAYDVLAARGGTDVGKREEARALITNADSLPVLERGIRSFKQEMVIAKKAADAAEHLRGADTGGPKEGDTSTSKSGKPIVFHNGQWEYK